ncbi:hypothetical protein A7U60_g4712 [Sanghuangporus baumii]|uniref:Uncharacterized protein n=1 Tax=Sanghuangporus baumii TaxID=108892 RepID=A0A9Q5HY70_SANBA|nr:hypothetical protein A7U60_g4712 [Sanghuangporus baumii]
MQVICVLCRASVSAGRGLTIHLKKCKGKAASSISLTTVKNLGPAPRASVTEQDDMSQSIQYNEDFREDSLIQDFSMEIDEPAPTQPALLEAPVKLPRGSKRSRKLPVRFKDHVPSSSRPSVLPTVSLPHLLDHIPAQPVVPSPPVPVSSPSPEPDEPASEPRRSYTSPSNDYELFRVYPDFPDDEPDTCLELEDLCDSPNLSRASSLMPSLMKNPYAPFKNFTSFLVTKWANRPVDKKTLEEIDELIQGVILHPLFKLEDLRDYSAKAAHDQLDKYNNENLFMESDGWREGSVKLKLPAEDGKRHSEGEIGAPEVEIKGIYYRPITLMIYNALDNPNASPFHFLPYKEFWNLANFGTASLWPLYMHLGSQSKYIHGKSSESACHHLAYIPSLPTSIQDVYKDHYGRGASAGLFTYLRRELMHKVLSLVLFQSEFLEIYANGIRFRCPDNIIRRLFSRIMAYSADYPERMLVSTLKVMVSSAKVKAVLDSPSLVPIHNAFSELAPFSFDFYEMFAPDIMHKFELGVWGKTIFPHLIRVLEAQGGDIISTFNNRYRALPTFGNDMICLFPENTAAMSKLAARDFEDLLQCSIPVFEELLKEKKHNKLISQILFTLATWHSLAKLRTHTDTTLRALEATTIELGREARLLKDETSIYKTVELQWEIAARGRRQIALLKRGGENLIQANKGDSVKPTPKRKELNVNTPKFHSLGDYVQAIRRLGTTDNYSTQIGESQHKRVKQMYGRTNKRNAAKDVSKLEGRARVLELIGPRMSAHHPRKTITTPRISPDIHYHMPASEKESTNIGFWLHQNKRDPAVQTFRGDLRTHLLGRILKREEYADLTPGELGGLHIRHDKLYWHKVIQINYTTYDLRQKQDTCNPSTHPDVMMLAPEVDALHLYMYARIVRLFHVKVAYNGPGRQLQDYKRMNVAWVRWFQYDSSSRFSLKEKRLPQIQFSHYSEPDAFGFIDPDLIIRAVHLMPRFAKGYTTSYLPPSLVRLSSFKDQDFQFYYVNIFVDRDIFMRFRGGGIGHKSTWHLNERLMEDLQMETDKILEADNETQEIDAVELFPEEEVELIDRYDGDEPSSDEGEVFDESEGELENDSEGDNEYAEL